MKEKIRVSTEKIREKGSEWEEAARQAKGNMQQVREGIERMDYGFCCEAASVLYSSFLELAKEGEQKLEELRNHLKKLQDIAGIYEEAEKENEFVTADY